MHIDQFKTSLTASWFVGKLFVFKVLYVITNLVALICTLF